MRYTEAIETHIDQQYAQVVEQMERYDWPKTTREEMQEPGYSSQFEIARNYATAVAERMGEFVSFGVFDNCREHGITVTASPPGIGWTFCMYEHRNSDEICIEGCPTAEMKEWGPYGGRNKYDVMHRSRYDDLNGAIDAMVAFLQASIEQDSPTRESLMQAVLVS